MKKDLPKILMLLFILLVILIIILGGILLYVIITIVNKPPTSNTVDTVSIASWNLQNFGPIKAANETLLNFYANKLDDYDLFIIQEIKDPTTEAVESLAKKLPRYNYVISKLAGQGTSKEQYAIFYKKELVLLSTKDWTENEQDNFERPPLEATFKVKNWTFTLYTIHIKVGNVPQELSNLENLIGTPTQDTILLGDLNADGDNYYNGVIHNFLGWHWLITSGMDTTVAKSSNAYDRIIINDATKNNFIKVGIMNDVTVSQSDHYLVYAVFNPNEN
jgi:endonuclease/exonuclease/phosphatase family metal-dependent hydrolase